MNCIYIFQNDVIFIIQHENVPFWKIHIKHKSYKFTKRHDCKVFIYPWKTFTKGTKAFGNNTNKIDIYFVIQIFHCWSLIKDEKEIVFCKELWKLNVYLNKIIV